MDYLLLGKSGIKVSQICLGTMNFANTTDLQQATDIINQARDVGINFVDTVDGYTNKASKRILGKLIKSEGDNWILSTKIGQAAGLNKRKKGLSRKWMMEAIDPSLQRLETDYVDILYMQHVDCETPLDVSILAVGNIIAAGKAPYWGFSNHRGWQIGELIRICDKMSGSRPIVCQPYRNAIMQIAENDVLSAC